MTITFTAGIHTTLGGLTALDCRSDVTGAPTLNVTSANGAVLLGLLGLDGDDEWGEWSVADGGSLPADEFNGRLLIAVALIDTATADQGHPASTDGRITYGGRRPGYLAERLDELRTIADWAIAHHAKVAWH